MRLVLLFLILFSSCYRSSVDETIVAIQIQDRNGLTETISSSERLQTYNQTNFLASQPYKKVMRIYRNNGKSQSKITTYHSNGALWQYLEAEELRACGAYREWYSNGQKRIEATVIGGPAELTQNAQKEWLFDGLCQVWNDQGRPLASLPYRQGALEGKSLHYFPSGALQKEQPYSNHQLDGIAIEFYPNGEIRSKNTYKKGQLDGTSCGYYSTKEPAWEEYYREDLLVNGSYYNQKGEEITSVKDGTGSRALFDGDAMTHLIQISQGYAQGSVKQFSSKGELISTYTIKNGQKTGTETTYYSRAESNSNTPLPKLTVNWHYGSIHGTVKTWYNDGQLQSQREYSHNKKMGPSISWYRDGSLMLVEEYEEDKLTKGQYYKKNALDSISSVIHGNGIATLYDENGVFLRKATYIKGEPIDPGE